MSKSLPYLRLYPGDELQGPVTGCSMAAQGLWLRLRMIMHSCTPYGYLCPGKATATNMQPAAKSDTEQVQIVLGDIGVTPATDAMIARMCGIGVVELTTLVAELDEAGVTRYTVSRVMYCEELVMQASEREHWVNRKRRQRDLPFHGESSVTLVSRERHTDVTAKSRRLSSSLSSSQGRSAANGKRPPEAERRESANETAREQVSGKRGG